MGTQAEQSIIEVSLMTGFTPVETSIIQMTIEEIVDGSGRCTK